jgi:NAD(P)-dependent dehydrogenase (short-subunit alcohol dehydrogenase family)
MSQFTDKIALVTGAASGIGAAVAGRLARDGCAGLVLVDRDAEGLSKVNDAAAALGATVLTLAQDVGDAEAWLKGEGAIRRSFGRLDLAVANAGVGAHGPLAELKFEDWRKVMSTNLDGAFLAVSTAMRLIGEGGRGGAIVVNASVMAAKVEIGAGAYAVSKAGAAQLARVAAKEGAAQRIRVNALLPGGVETPIWRGVPFFQQLVAAEGSEEAAFAKMGMANPLGRYATPEEIAGLAAFLLSDDCSYVTGAGLVCDGGYLL